VVEKQPRLAYRAREGGGEVVEDKTTPSGLRFEQGRGGGWLRTRDGPSDSRFE